MAIIHGGLIPLVSMVLLGALDGVGEASMPVITALGMIHGLARLGMARVGAEATIVEVIGDTITIQLITPLTQDIIPTGVLRIAIIVLMQGEEILDTLLVEMEDQRMILQQLVRA